MVYKYKDHRDIHLEEVDIEDINDFLNGLEEWEDDYDVEVPSYLNLIH
jgi:hypothetical protein